MPPIPGSLEETPLHCPQEHVYDLEPIDLDELQPLTARLSDASPVSEPLAFPRGTLLPDGRLDLCKQSLGLDGCRIVTEAVARCSHVSSLLLGTNGIGDDGARQVADLARQNPHLTTLYLGCNRIGERGATALADTLTPDSPVTGLWLKRNALGPLGVAALARMLESNATLRALDLVTTRMDVAGFDALMDALTEKNRSVAYLFLDANGLGVAQARKLALLLKKNDALQRLYLAMNPLKDEGILALAEGLARNRTLVALDVASCGFSESGGEALASAVENHPALRRVRVGEARAARAVRAQPNRLSSTLRKRLTQRFDPQEPTPAEIASVHSVYR